MTNASIEVKIGEFSFSGTGSQDWLSEQLDKILDQAEGFADLATKLAPAPSPSLAVNQNQLSAENSDVSNDTDIANKSLAKFLSEKNATKTQNDKFLATAIWLTARGRARVTTADIAGALKDAQQTRINKPSQCLGQNIGKGFCEKDGNQFFVTEDGRNAIGV